MIMRIRQDFRLGIGVLVVFQWITAFAAIGLMARMTPAIAKILGENELTIEVAEEMLLALARRPLQAEHSPLEAEYLNALERAKNNVTEPGEPEVLSRLEKDSSAAWQGEPGALRRTINDLNVLIEVNREALQRADREARRLGAAGAWAAVFLAVASFAASVLVSRRLSARILDPLRELHEVMEAWRHGDRYRRCRVWHAGFEMRRILESTNLLLDQHFKVSGQPAAAGGGLGEAAMRLVEEYRSPAFVVDEHGAVSLANSAALERLNAPDAKALRAELSAAPLGKSSGLLRVSKIRDLNLWLCEAS